MNLITKKLGTNWKKESVIPFTISKGRGAIAGIVLGASKWEARPGAILSQTWLDK